MKNKETVETGRKYVLQLLYLRSEEHTSELQSQSNLVCRLLLEKKKNWKRPSHGVTSGIGMMLYSTARRYTCVGDRREKLTLQASVMHQSQHAQPVSTCMRRAC